MGVVEKSSQKKKEKMVKKRKVESDSGSDSEGEKVSKNEKKKKKKSKEKKRKAESDSGSDSGQEEVSKNGPWHISNVRRVSVEEFRGKKLVSIREYYEKDGKMLPGRKGISLPQDQWIKLKSFVDNVDKSFAS